MDKELILQLVKSECIKYKELKDILIEPVLENFEDIDGNSFNLWIVMKKEEYLITYNPKAQKFGVGFKNIINQYVYLGDNRSVVEAYETIISHEN